MPFLQGRQLEALTMKLDNEVGTFEGKF